MLTFKITQLHMITCGIIFCHQLLRKKLDFECTILIKQKTSLLNELAFHDYATFCSAQFAMCICYDNV